MSPTTPAPPNGVFALAQTDGAVGIQTATNPEPATMLLFGLGMRGSALTRREKHRAQ